MMKYKLSNDYKRLKELLDEGHQIIIIWQHDATLRLFAGIATVRGGVEGHWYSLDCWSYFPTINKESFESKCKKIGFSYIIPEQNEEI